MDANKKVTTWKVRSHSNGDDHYYVTRWMSGAVTCSCPHYVHRLAGTVATCKHIDDALAGYFLDQTNHIEVTKVQTIAIKVRRAALQLVMG